MVSPTIVPKVLMSRKLWESLSFQKISITVSFPESDLKPDVCRQLLAGSSVFPDPSWALPCISPPVFGLTCPSVHMEREHVGRNVLAGLSLSPLLACEPHSPLHKIAKKA